MSNVNGFFSLGAVTGAALAGVLSSSGGPPATLLAAAGVGLAVIVAVAAFTCCRSRRAVLPATMPFGCPGGRPF